METVSDRVSIFQCLTVIHHRHSKETRNREPPDSELFRVPQTPNLASY